jgi:putative ABC transport system permease protein
MLIGGTGILALMFLSVRERAGEIGLRIAVGAMQRDILIQFMLEATALALAGWVTGLVLSSLVGGGLALATKWSVALPGAALLSSFVMAATLGVIFGSLPARQAARLHPITALGMK